MLVCNYRKLTNKDFQVLKAIENGMKYYEWVPLEEVIKYTRYPQKKVSYILSNLTKNKLVQRRISSYEGYKIHFKAYDMLALNTMVKHGSIDSIGDIIGVGKESLVYLAKGGITNIQVVIKFHREGMSFKHVKKKRAYSQHQWLYTACAAATREYHALTSLYPNVNVPQPIDYNRHAVVMSLIEGKELVYTKLNNPEWYLNEIINQIGKAYNKGFIHGDLSEFNIMVNSKGCKIIDWPQYVTPNHKNAKEFLYRDIKNILTFFNRKYGIKKNINEIINNITCQKEPSLE